MVNAYVSRVEGHEFDLVGAGDTLPGQGVSVHVFVIVP